MLPNDKAAQPENTKRLHGRLGLAGIIFIVVAGAAPLTVIGGPVPLAFAIGNGAGVPAMLLITGAVLVLFAIGFTAMNKYVRTAGAFYSYAHTGISRSVGIGTGYVALLSYLSLYIGMFGLLGPAIGSMVQLFGGPMAPWWLWSGIALVVIGMIGYRNIEFSGIILGILLVAEVLIVFLLDSVILFTSAHGQGLSTGFLDLQTVFSGAPGIAFLFAVLGFIGVEATAVFRDEAANPEKNVPRATYISVIFIAVFYSATSWLMISGVGDSSIVAVAAEAPDLLLPNLMKEYVGQVGSDIVLALFVTSIIACILTFHNIVARYVFSLSARGLLPTRLSGVHPKLGSPSTASVTVSIVAGVCVALGVMLQVDAVAQFYTWLVGLASLGYVVLLVITTVAVLMFFARRRHIKISAMRRLAAPLLALIGLLTALVLILFNLLTLVGGNFAVAITVVVLLIAAFSAGPIIGTLLPNAGLEEAPGADLKAQLDALPAVS
ncbi:APC family permease [Pseudomonas aeruginosa]|nr:APC family permease [Pseudomonas aeruginosa]MCO3162967.1 APC family permease [Pseudomonas aeruginosa]